MTPEQVLAQQIANRKRAIIAALALDPKVAEALDLFIAHSGLGRQVRVQNHFRGLLLALIEDGLRRWTAHNVADFEIRERIFALLDQNDAEAEWESERQGTA
jgi:hypothetical protein